MGLYRTNVRFVKGRLVPHPYRGLALFPLDFQDLRWRGLALRWPSPRFLRALESSCSERRYAFLTTASARRLQGGGGVERTLR